MIRPHDMSIIVDLIMTSYKITYSLASVISHCRTNLFSLAFSWSRSKLPINESDAGFPAVGSETVCLFFSGESLEPSCLRAWAWSRQPSFSFLLGLNSSVCFLSSLGLLGLP